MIACTAGLLLALATSPASAPVDLRWDAPAGCPDQAALERQVAALLAGHPAPADGGPRLAFRVERRGDQWLLHGEITGPRGGQRELGATSCAELVEAAALITAIAVDPSFADPTVVPAPPPTPASPAITGAEPPATLPGAPPIATREPPAIVPRAPPATTVRDPPARPSTRPGSRPGALLGVAGGLGLGALPAPAGLLRISLGLRGRAWSVALQPELWLPRDGLVAGAPEVGGRFWLAAVGVRGCGILRAGRLEFPLCAAISVGAMSGRGIGELTAPRRQISPWVAASAGPGLRVPLTRRLGFTVAADLLVVLARPRFEVPGRGRACCDDPVGGQFTAGLDLRLP